MLFLLTSALALASLSPVTLTSEEAASLSRGELVVRPPSSTGEMVGVVDITGVSPSAVWDAVLDFKLRESVVSSVDSIVVYAPESDPKGLGATFTLSILGSKIVYHLRYKIDRASGVCTYTLDPERTHDIASVEGIYRIEPVGSAVRLTYQSKTDAGRSVPDFVKRWLAVSSIKTQLEAMKRRALGQ